MTLLSARATTEYSFTDGSISGLTASKTYTYLYSDNNWKDKLTSYNGKSITYDAIGNPLSYYNGNKFSWQNGRQLAGLTTSSGQGISYTYNANGIRTTKTVNGTKTYYTIENNNVVHETNGTDSIWYYYDALGNIVGFELNDIKYYYVKNIQGDVIAIIDNSGNKVVEYTYNSWGKVISINGALANTVGSKNPYRYRSYRYDNETGFYYLNSRYYDPEIGRFINADGYVSTGQGISGYNMFEYGSNNPVYNADPSGNFFVPVILVAVVVISSCIILSGCSSSNNQSKPSTTSSSTKSTTSSKKINVGSAKKYKKVKAGDNTQNCYTYALGIKGSTDPGVPSTGARVEDISDVNAVAAAVDKDLDKLGYSHRRLKSATDIVNSEERRIALRVTTHQNRTSIERSWLPYDYHFMVQTNTGQWAEKKGLNGGSRLGEVGKTPDDLLWDFAYSPDCYYEDYYDSEIIYFAIGDPK